MLLSSIFFCLENKRVKNQSNWLPFVRIRFDSIQLNNHHHNNLHKRNRQQTEYDRYWNDAIREPIEATSQRNTISFV